MPHTLIFLTISAVFALVAAPEAVAADAGEPVVTVRRFEVPAPQPTRMMLNTAQAAKQPVSGASAVPLAAMPAPSPVSAPSGVIVAGSASAALEQPGMPDGAREAAVRNGVAVQVTPASAPVEAPAAVASPDLPVEPPPPVFQTMSQAAEAMAKGPGSLAAAPVLDEPTLSLYEQARAYVSANPKSIPIGVAILVLLAFGLRRAFSSRDDDDSDE